MIKAPPVSLTRQFVAAKSTAETNNEGSGVINEKFQFGSEPFCLIAAVEKVFSLPECTTPGPSSLKGRWPSVQSYFSYDDVKMSEVYILNKPPVLT